MVGLTSEPIDPSALLREVADPSCGAVLLFTGTTRDNIDGLAVKTLFYEAYETMAIASLRALVERIDAQWPGSKTAIVHRTGEVPIGEISVAIATASPHRQAAYEANRFAIEALKADIPIWKKEITVDGSTWKANTPA